MQKQLQRTVRSGEQRENSSCAPNRVARDRKDSANDSKTRPADQIALRSVQKQLQRTDRGGEQCENSSSGPNALAIDANALAIDANVLAIETNALAIETNAVAMHSSQMRSTRKFFPRT